MFRRYGKKSRGQALIEYALLLMIAVLASTAYFQLDGTLKDKLLIIASDFVQDTPGVPYEVPPIKEKVNLSPPVADFYVPEPNYKGRDIRLVNRSFDTDGVIEHYIWNVNGTEYRQTRFDADLDEGLVVKFRYSGTYTATLIVIDNDGLVSNKVTKTIRVVNRFPTLDITVQNEQGDVVGMGGTITVYEGCSARFQTYYDDPDLPYEELRLYSRFTDHSGVVSTYNTVNNDFVRTFFNEGTSEYYVEIKDEDNAVASGRVYVKVVKNPNPNGACGNITIETKPKYRIEVSGYVKKDETKTPRVYYFLPGTKATLTAVVEWGQYPAHSLAYYWSTTSWPNPQNEWQNKQTIQRPYSTEFKIGDTPYTVTGMARDSSATSTEPNPNLRGMSNKDTVRLEVICTPEAEACKVPPTPVITVHNVADTRTPPADSLLQLPVGRNYDKRFPYNNGAYTLTINSRDSKSNTGGSIAGVRFFIPDASGGKWYPVDNNPKNNFGNGNAVKIKDINGNEQWWFPLTPDSPDTLGGKTFKIGEGSGALKNEWTYKLHVIDSNGIPSKDPAVKTIRLVEVKNPPTAVCTYNSGNPARMKKGQSLGNALTAAQSKDSNGGTDGILARWKLPNGSWSNWQKRTNGVPDSLVKNLAEGQHQIQLQVKDKNGTESSVVTCNIVVEPATRPPIDVQFWSIDNRVGLSGLPVKVSNQSKPTKEVKKVAWKISTPSNPGDSPPAAKTVDGPANNSNFKLHNGVMQSAFYVHIYVTNESETANCTSGSKRVNFRNGYWCTRSAIYFRLRTVTKVIPDPLGYGRQRCQYDTISASKYPSYADLKQKFWNQIKNEVWGQYSVPAMLEEHYRLKNCVRVY